MGWRDLLQETGETLVSPWVGGRNLRSGSRVWKITGRLPPQHGWGKFQLQGRRATFLEPCDPNPDLLTHKKIGYLVGDRLIPTEVESVGDLSKFEPVRLIEAGLERFSRVSAGRVSEDGPLVYLQQEMPLGPEWEVQSAFVDGKDNLDNVREVTPALAAAFVMEVRQRAEAERCRLELEAQLQREEEERIMAARSREIVRTLGDGQSRRVVAASDFVAAARAALAVGGAEYLDHRGAPSANETVVQFRLGGRRYECVCNTNTLQITDSGICLTAEYDQDGFSYGDKGDSFFTLESLPGVILQAEREGRLVVFRHV